MKIFKLFAIIQCLGLVSFYTAFGQTSVEISGPTSVATGVPCTYNAVFKNGSGQVVPPPQLYTDAFDWWIPGEYNLLSYSAYSVQIEWTSAGSRTMTYNAQALNNVNYSNTLTVNVSQGQGQGPPVAIGATSTTASTFVANWNTVSGATGYRLDVSTSAGFGSFVSGYNNLAVSGTSQLVSGLTNNVMYYYRIRAVTGSGTSANSNTISVQTGIPAGAASSVEVTGETSVMPGTSYTYSAVFRNAVWQVVPMPALYTDAFDWIISGEYTLEAYSSSSCGIRWTSPGPHTIRYTAQSLDNVSFSDDLTVSVSFITPVATAATGATANSFVANWNSVPGATSYLLEVATNDTFTAFVSGYTSLSVSGTSQTVSGLTPGTNYYYRVRAVSSYGTSPISNPVAARTLTVAPVANAATNITTTAFTGSWNAVAGASDYLLEVSTTSTFTTIATGAYVFGTNYQITGLSPSTTYFYRVVARNLSGSSVPSNTVRFTTLPLAPVATSATNITTTSFTANWNSVVSSGYRIDVAVNANFSSFVSGYNNLAVSGTSLSVTGLSPGITYYYRVRAVNVDGAPSANSNTIVLSTLPAAPVATAATNLTTTSFWARWDASTGATGYLLEVATDNTFSGTVLNYTATSNFYVVTGLSPTVIYYYRIRATNASGTSAYSNVIQTATLPVAPVATRATNASANSFTANWTSVTSSGYQFDLSTDPTFATYVSGYQARSVTALSLAITAITVKTKYYYRVRAVNALGGTSANSNTMEVADLVGYNFIRTAEVVAAGKTTVAQVDAASVDERRMKLVFFDGLGRPLQSVSVQSSPGGKDLIQPLGYDAFGREPKKYLPYTEGTSGWFKVDALKNPVTTATTEPAIYRSGKHYAFYQTGGVLAKDQFPYAETRFEPSPLNRALKQGAPGAAWQPDAVNAYASTDHTTKMAYEFNQANEVLLWKYTDASATYPLGQVNTGTGTTPAYHAANTLVKNKVKDEQNNEIITFEDQEGHLLLKQKPLEPGVYANTYYVYDNFGNLVCVIPPEATRLITKSPSEYLGKTDAVKEAFLARWAFRYVYDARNRLAIKHTPGVQQVYMVYDGRDRLVLTQDGNQRAASTKYWTFTKYDDLNRPILTGIKDTAVALTQAAMQDVVNGYYALITTTKPWRNASEKYVGASAAGNVHAYTNNAYPQVTTTTVLDVNRYLSVTYYDTYDFRSDWLGSYTYISDGLTSTNATGTYTQRATGAENTAVKGQVTGVKTKVLDGGVAGGYTWLKSVTYYDDKYRVIQTVVDNYKGGVDRGSSLYDFAGQVLKSKETHTQSDPSWQEMAFLKQEGNKLIAVTGAAQWGFGGMSKEVLPAGVDGWFEVTVTETASQKIIGFNDSNAAGAVSSDLNYAFRVNGTTLYVQENTAVKATVTGIKSGDVLRMERTGTTVTFRRNGQPITTTAITASTTALFIDHAFLAAGYTWANVRASFSTSTKFISRTFDYDRAGRLLRTWHQLDGGANILLAHHTYNELGQLVDKKLHSTVANATDTKQSVDYRYNIRGWLTSVNNPALSNDGTTNNDATDYFGMSLSYDVTDADLGSVSLYNGNIAAIKWSNFPGSGDIKQKGTTYTYDALDRLTASTYKEKTASWAATANNGFTETGYSYDLNGNIKTLQRNDKRASGWMDNLVYNYGSGTTQSNKLLKVEDLGDDNTGFIDGNPSLATDFTTATDDYRYDANGNLVNDRNKGIGTTITDNVNRITYNYLNLPETVTKGDNTIRYVYDAGGRKLSQVVTYGATQKQTDYAGVFHYENDMLQFIGHEEGRIMTVAVKQLYTNPCDAVDADITTLGAAVSAYSANGQNYVMVTSNDATPGNGIVQLGGPVTVAAGDTYLVRAKGYRTTNAVSLQVKAGTTVLGNAALPGSAAGEGWVEQIVTVPAGSTTLEAGLVWGATVAAGEVFYLNELEIRKLTASSPEYQYDLKDHLNNVRLTFTTQITTASYTAGFESGNQSSEAAAFGNYPSGGQLNTQATNARTGTNSQLLNGGYSGQVGLAKSFSVMPGDVVGIQAYAKYSTPTSTNTNYAGFVTSLLSAFNLAAPAVGETGTAAWGVNTFGTWEIGGSGNASSTDAAKIFVTIILFDRNYNLVDVAYQASSGSGNLMSSSYTVKEPGYAYLYISNEHPTQVNAYFDDVTMTHTPGAIIQTNDYYPFGLAFNAYTRENATQQRYKFNSMEMQDELNLGWYDYLSRQYDPTLGRFTSVDPAADLMRRVSPYAYAFNNPVRFTDPDGMMPDDMVDDDDERRKRWNFDRPCIGCAGPAGRREKEPEMSLSDFHYGGGRSGEDQEFNGGFEMPHMAMMTDVAGDKDKKSDGGSGGGKAGGSGRRKEGGTRVGNALRILGSFFAVSPNKTFAGKVIQIISHFTWELPQQLVGVLTASVVNAVGGIKNAYVQDGALVLESKFMAPGVGYTLGNVITVGAGSKQETISHEYGHYVQSRRFGPGYLPIFALPSVARATVLTVGWALGGFQNVDYEAFYTESNATKLGRRFFD